jgi:aarF domain-containing kinase
MLQRPAFRSFLRRFAQTISQSSSRRRYYRTYASISLASVAIRSLILSPAYCRPVPRVYDDAQAIQTTIVSKSALSSLWQNLAAKLRRWLHLFYRWCYLMFIYSPVLVSSPLLLLQSELLTTCWFDLLLACVKHGGPCGIKFAQWMSTRPDLFPAALCRCFQDLQSYQSAATLSWAKVQQVLTQAYGSNWQERLGLHIELNKAGEAGEPSPVVLGEGCVAQVLLGRLQVSEIQSAHGQSQVWRPVAVKIIRPEARDSISADVALMLGVAKALEHQLPALQAISLVDSVQEFQHIMLRQLDMREEAGNLQRFRQHFCGGHRRGLLSARAAEPLVSFPEPVLELAREQVLVESCETGPLLRDYMHSAHCSEADRHVLAKIGLEAIFQMVFVDSFVHAGEPTRLHAASRVLLC